MAHPSTLGARAACRSRIANLCKRSAPYIGSSRTTSYSGSALSGLEEDAVATQAQQGHLEPLDGPTGGAPTGPPRTTLREDMDDVLTRVSTLARRLFTRGQEVSDGRGQGGRGGQHSRVQHPGRAGGETGSVS